MPMQNPAPGLQLGALWFVVALATACGGGDDDVIQPPPPSEGSIPINVGDTVSGIIEAAGSLVFTMPASGEAAIFAQAPDGKISIRVRDSVTDQAIGFADIAGATLRLLDHRGDRFQATPGRRILINLIRFDQIPSSRFRLLVYPVNRAPEHAPGAYELGNVVSDEPLETSADIDEFTLAGTVVGAEWIVYAAIDSNPAADAIGIAVVGPDGITRGSGALRPPGTPLADAGAAFASVTTTGAHLLRFSGNLVNAPWRTTAYDFQVRARNRAPEFRPPALAPGDSITAEVIDFAGDIDEFVLNGAPGSQVNLFFALPTAGGDPRRAFSVIVRNSARVQLGQVGAHATLSNESNSGRITLPADGQLLLEIVSDASPGQYGSYHLLAYPIVTSPERASPTHLTASDSVLTEVLDREGDIDEFTLSFPSNRQLNAVISVPPAATGRFSLEVRNSSESLVGGATATGTDTLAASGRSPLVAGTYHVTVRELDPFNPAPLRTRGPYQIRAYAINPAPETAPVTLNLDQLLSGEQIDPMSDVDTFAFAGVRGQIVRLRLDAAVPDALGSNLLDYTPGNMPGTNVGVIASAPSGSASLPVELGTTGHYKVSVEGRVGVGGYSVGLETVSTQPESVNPLLSAGIPVTSEAIETPGDIDDFELLGVPGSEFMVTILRTTLNGTGSVCADVREGESPNRLGAMPSHGFREGTQRLRFPASGRARVRVWMVQNNDCPLGTTSVATRSATAGYELVAYLVNPAPELVPPVIAVGDTIRGETLGHPGDLDEFTVSLQAGERVVPAVREVFPQFNPSNLLSLRLLAPDGTQIGGVSSTSTSGPWVTGTSVTAPVTGTYRIQLAVFNSTLSPISTGPYEFVLAR